MVNGTRSSAASDPASRPPRLVFLLTAAERAVRRRVAAASQASGQQVGPAAAGVLLYLRGRDDALVGDVGTALGASPAGTTGLLQRMTAAGLLTRGPDPDDRRAVRVRLTPAGRDAADQARSGAAELNALLSQGFTADDLDVVRRWLEHVRAL